MQEVDTRCPGHLSFRNNLNISFTPRRLIIIVSVLARSGSERNGKSTVFGEVCESAVYFSVLRVDFLNSLLSEKLTGKLQYIVAEGITASTWKLGMKIKA